MKIATVGCFYDDVRAAVTASQADIDNVLQTVRTMRDDRHAIRVVGAVNDMFYVAAYAYVLSKHADCAVNYVSANLYKCTLEKSHKFGSVS